jgi:nucleoside 2-deoxyribosyltransferase
MKIYFAAPLFNQIELDRNRTLCSILEENGFTVYLPQRDGLLLIDLIKDGMDPREAKELIFCNDVEAILDCDLLLIILDGRTVDEGAAFELGIAFANRKKCIGLQTDIRRLLPYGNNPMLEIAIEKIFDNEKELISALNCISGVTQKEEHNCL